MRKSCSVFHAGEGSCINVSSHPLTDRYLVNSGMMCGGRFYFYQHLVVRIILKVNNTSHT